MIRLRKVQRNYFFEIDKQDNKRNIKSTSDSSREDRIFRDLVLKWSFWGCMGAQLAKHPTSDCCSGHDLTVRAHWQCST